MRTPEQIEAMVPVSDRSAQRFPRLRDAQLAVVKRFAEAEARGFAPGQFLFQIGDHTVPTWFLLGISGPALTGRALNQARKFGAEVAIPLVATRLECSSGPSAPRDTLELTLSDQGSVRARSVVIASGARYKRPDITNLRKFEGDNVHYWASPVAAKLCADAEIILVGAGNSAGRIDETSRLRGW